MAWTIFLPTFLTATVEWVEAFTIVLAVSLAIGWRASLGAAAAALATLAALTAATGVCSRSGSGWSGFSS
jgi:Ca2+/H+ antiporter, TMEM165/GDT1 family